jgi:phage terminase large subunit-like protein
VKWLWSARVQQKAREADDWRRNADEQFIRALRVELDRLRSALVPFAAVGRAAYGIVSQPGSYSLVVVNSADGTACEAREGPPGCAWVAAYRVMDYDESEVPE